MVLTNHALSQPPRAQPKTFILLLKTHKLTAMLTIPSTSTVHALKEEALSALQSDVMAAPNPHPEAMEEDESEWTVPEVSSVDDFELAKAVKEKGRPTGQYETLNVASQLKNVVSNWEPVFVQFREPNGEWTTSALYYMCLFTYDRSIPHSFRAWRNALCVCVQVIYLL